MRTASKHGRSSLRRCNLHLALLSQLSRIQFADDKTVSEQLPQFEALILEYERISGQKYSDDAKVAAVLLACPTQIRQHLQMWLTNSTTYEQLKDRIIQLEAVTTKWDSTNSLMLPTRVTGDDYDKGKKDGKGSWKGPDKGKSMWEKGPGKKRKSSDKGSKGGKQSNACHLCGKVGHFAGECWKRVNQVEDNTNINAGGASSSSTGQAGSGQASGTGHQTSIKMVRLETPPDVNSVEIFDLTTPREESGAQHPWRVGMIELAENEVFYDIEEHYEFEDAYMECHEQAVQVPENVAIVAMDLQDEEDVMVKMVRIQEIGYEDECMVTLDSGADVSVLPRCYAGTGERQQEREDLRMVDAQGRKIAHDGITRARVRVRDKTGKEIELVEEFVLGNVQHPILRAGKLLKRGWSLNNGRKPTFEA